MTYLVLIAFIAILASLGVALAFMLRAADNTPGKPRKMARALAIRVALSVALFLCILLAWQLGYITPSGIRTGQ